MDFNTLYVLRYRVGSVGVSTGYILASSQAKAEQVGQAWCNDAVNRRYIGVTKAVLADESILNEELVGVGAGVEASRVPSLSASVSAPSTSKK